MNITERNTNNVTEKRLNRMCEPEWGTRQNEEGWIKWHDTKHRKCLTNNYWLYCDIKVEHMKSECYPQ